MKIRIFKKPTFSNEHLVRVGATQKQTKEYISWYLTDD